MEGSGPLTGLYPKTCAVADLILGRTSWAHDELEQPLATRACTSGHIQAKENRSLWEAPSSCLPHFTWATKPAGDIVTPDQIEQRRGARRAAASSNLRLQRTWPAAVPSPKCATIP